MTDLEAFHMQAFVDFMRAVPNIDVLFNKFQTDSSINFIPRSPIEMMVDKATGYDRQRYETFVNWCADEYGRDCLPVDILAAIKAGPPSK